MKPSDFVTAALLACIAGPAAGCHRGAAPAAPAPNVSADSAVTATGESAIAPLVTLTPEAEEAVARVVREQRVAGRWYLRVRVVPGGCTGFQHKLDLEFDPPAPDDRVTESSGVSVVVSAQQVEMLRGTRVDFGVEGGREGFIVKNPNFEGEGAKRW